MDQPQAIQQPEGATTYPAFDLSVLEAKSPAEEDPSILLPILEQAGASKAAVRPTTVATDKTEAAKGAMLSHGDPNTLVDTYNRILGEMQNRDGYSQSLEEIKQRTQASSEQAAKMATANALIDGEFKTLPGGDVAAAGVLGQTLTGISDEDLDAAYAIKSHARKIENPTAATSIGVNAIIDEVRAKQANQKTVNNVMMEMGEEYSLPSFVAGVTQAAMPFVESEQTRRLLKDFEQSSGLNVAGSGTSFILTGEVKHAIREGLDNLYKTNPQEAERVSAEMLGKLRDNTNVLYKNDFSSYMRLQELFGLDGGEYTTFDRVLDDAGSVFDLFGVGGIARFIKTGKKVFTQGPKMVAKEVWKDTVAQARYLKEVGNRDIFDRAAWKRSEVVKSTTIDSTAPTSPARLSEGVNPPEARALTQMALRGSEEEAVAIYGTANKGDIEVRTQAPTITDGINSIENKVWIKPDSDLVDILRNSDSLNKSEEELANIVKEIKKDFEGAKGVVVRNNMTVIKTDNGDLLELGGGVKQNLRGDIVHTQVTYGLKDSGFRTAQDAYDSVEFALRDRGVLKENMQLFKRVDDRYVPVKADEVLKMEKIEEDSLRAMFAKGPGAKKSPKAASDMSLTDLRSMFAKGPNGSPAAIEPGSMRDLVAKGPKAKKGKPKAAKDVVDGDKRSLMAVGPKAVNAASNTEPEYIMAISHQEKAMVTDLEAMSNPEIAHNWVDRIFAGYNGVSLSDSRIGSLNSFLFSPTAAFKSLFTFKAASNATDKVSKIENVLLNTTRQFSDELKKLPKEQLAKFQEYVIKANKEGLKFDSGWARTNAWSEDAIQAHHTFRRLQDQMFYLENLDKIKSERAHGARLWTNKATGESQLVRPVAQNQVNKRFDGKYASVYDSVQGKVVQMTHDEVMKLYKEGGELLDARRPVQHESGVITLIKSENGAGASYHRALSDTDQVLSYREGYYARVYKGHYFVRKSVKDHLGNHMYWKAVGNVDSMRDAQTLRKQFLDDDWAAGKDDYLVSEDMKGSSAYDDAMHDLHQQGGRSAQRIRGEQLKKDLTQEDLELADTADPMEIVVNAIKSISKRTAMRDWFDTSKARLLNRYTDKDILPKDPNTGQIIYPSKASDIHYRGAGMADKKAIADARTLFNYIRSMEDGYANFIDEGWKGALNAVANTLTPWSGLEKGVRSLANSKGPVALSRQISTTMLLFTNPLRQIIIQPSQSMQLVAIAHPQWSFKQGSFQMGAMFTKIAGGEVNDITLKMAGLTRKEFDSLHKAFMSSGQWEAVDKQNMVRGVLGDMADRAMSGKVKNFVTSPLHYSRKYGIDFGERLNSTLTFLAFADNAKRAGKSLDDPRVVDEVLSSARSFSGSMNEAGDMPYNHGALGMMFQFAQIGHKMVENMLWNQNLTRTQRARLAAVNFFVFGIPASTMYESHLSEHLPEDPEVRQAVQEGFLNWTANEAIELFSDSKTRINFSGSVSPFSAAFATTVHNLVSTDIMTTIAKTPTGGLVFGSNPKLATFTRELSNWFVPSKTMSPSDLSTVMRSAGDMFGGLSNGFKANAILQTGRSMKNNGATADYHADYVAAMAKVFGFRTQDEEALTAIANMQWDEKQRLEDVGKMYKIWANQIKLREGSLDDTTAMQQCYAIGFDSFGGNPAFWNEWEKHCLGGVKRGEFSPLQGIYESLRGTATLDEGIEKLRILPDDQKTPDTNKVMQALIQLRDSKGELTSGR